MIKLYSLRLPASERKNIQRTLERLDKLDSYIVNSIRIRPTMETQERVETLWDYSDKMHDLYEKVLDFKGRGEIYEKLPKMWERIQKENDKYWKGIKGSHEGYINLNKHFIQSAGNSTLQGIKELYAMQEQAQEEYDER